MATPQREQADRKPGFRNLIAKLKMPVLIVAGDAGVSTLEHNVALFKLLGGGASRR